MKNKMEWNPAGASSQTELMDVLLFAASGLKNQVLTSKVLNTPQLEQLRSRISEIADELYGIQQDVVVSKLQK